MGPYLTIAFAIWLISGFIALWVTEAWDAFDASDAVDGFDVFLVVLGGLSMAATSCRPASRPKQARAAES